MKINFLETVDWDKFKKNNRDVCDTIYNINVKIYRYQGFGIFLEAGVYWMEELDLYNAKFFHVCKKEGCQKILKVNFEKYYFCIYETDNEIKVEMYKQQN